ncbi:MAG: hypothetical protein ACOY0T_32770 [Myxococcota bacterium]
MDSRLGVSRLGARCALALMLVTVQGCSLSREPETPRESLLATRCRVGASDLGPLVTEWSAAEKSNLEALLQRNQAVAVQFTGCTMRLLPQCELGGNYSWQRTSPSRDTLRIRNEAELYTRLPLGALSLAGELKRSGELFIETTVAGQFRLHGFTAAQVPQTPGCLEATHVVGAVSVGAFQLRNAADIAGSGSARYAGVGEMGGSSRESVGVLGSAGDPNACGLATPEAANQNCSSPIQVFLSPIPGRTEPPGPPGSVKVGFMSGSHDARFDVYVDDEASCTTPCDRWVDPARPVVMRSRQDEKLRVPALAADKGPLQVTAFPTSRGQLATGITFTSLGGIAVATGIALTAIGCPVEGRGGMCAAGLITGGVGLPVTGGSILLILGALPRAHVQPIFDSSERSVAMDPGQRSLALGPVGVSGKF